MRYAYQPAEPNQTAVSAPHGSEMMRHGGEYDVPEAWAATLNGRIPGLDGNPCLIPLDNAPGAAAAAFIAAISEPTPHNPETPPPAVSTNVVEPVKRGRGRPPKVPA